MVLVTWWSKMDVGLDSNPKICAAGRAAREIFLFLVRRNGALEADGAIPIANLDPAYLARQLMMTGDEAVTGVTAAVTHGLIDVDEDEVRLCGWSPEWGSSKSGAERQARYKARKKQEKKAAAESPWTGQVTKGDAGDVTSVTGDVLDQTRPERDKAPPAPPDLSASPLPAAIVRTSDDLTRARVGAGSDVKRALVDAIWAEQEAGIDELQAAGVDQGAGRLGLVNGASKLELSRRLSERAADGRGFDLAAADCRRVLVEAKLTRSLRYVRGQHWEPKNFERSLATGPADIRQRLAERKAAAARDAARGVATAPVAAAPRPAEPSAAERRAREQEEARLRSEAAAALPDVLAAVSGSLGQLDPPKPPRRVETADRGSGHRAGGSR
jgi:hypothetical protein